jgi:hypothetical protein
MRTASLIILILILLIIFWPSDPTQINSESPQESQKATLLTEIQNTPTGDTRSTRVTRARSKKKAEDGEFDPYLEWELSKILSHFMVPPGEFRAASIEGSIAKLKVIYQKYSGHEIEISLKAPADSDNVISFQHDNISYRTLLGMVAGLSGYSMKIHGGEITFTEINSGPVRTTPDQSHPHALSEEAIKEILNTPEKTQEYLTSLGLHTPEVFGFPDNPVELANLINSLQEAQLDPENLPKQVRIENKLITFPPGFKFEITEMNSTEIQVAMRDWSQTKGVDIMTTPAVVARPGQDATIEIGKEFIFPIESETVDFRNEFIGLRLNATPVLAGLDQIQLGGKVNISSMDSPLNPDSFQENITETEIHAHDGHTVLIPVTGADGNTTIQVISSQRIDATGKSFWPPQPE